MKKRKSKFNNKKTIVDGITFDSKAEAARYVVLREREKAGEIMHLVLQPVYDFSPNDVDAPMRYVSDIGRRGTVLKYVADFSYIENHKLIIEDVKGVQTAVFKIKRALMKTINKIDVKIIKAGK